MIKNQTIYSPDIVTSSANVKSIIPPVPNKAGVATQLDQEDDAIKVKSLVRTIYDLLKIYGYTHKKIVSDPETGRKLTVNCRQKTNRDMMKLEERYLEFVAKAGLGSWKDLFKYKINAFFSYVMEQETPPMPKYLEEFEDLKNPSFLCFGRGKRFVRNMDRKTLESFAQSIAQSKKGAPPVSPEMVMDAQIKTFEHLTTLRQDIPDFSILNNGIEHHINRENICYQLRRTIREIFDKKMPVWDELTKPFVPSVNAQYNFSRDGLGAVGAFKSNERLKDIITKFEGDLVSKNLGPLDLYGEKTELYGKAGVEDQRNIDLNIENAEIKHTIGLHYDGKNLCKLWKDELYPALISEALNEVPETMVIGLPEPLKVRCITAGPPLTYTVLKPIQKWLWKNLKDHSVFQLIGRPVTSDIVSRQLGRLKVDEEFVSGDYKASTDNLHSWVSECLLDELIQIWKENNEGDLFDYYVDAFHILMRRALTGHKIMNPVYNEWYRKNILVGNEPDLFRDQKEGQLMGSIISFPFLCLANAAVCRYAMEVVNSRDNFKFKYYKLVDRDIPGYKTCRLLVNGDDCVFPGKIGTMFSTWKSITAFIGLESSVGKTFRDRRFLTINSCQYSYVENLDDWEGSSGMTVGHSLEEIKYVNLGLVYGQKKDGRRGKPFYRLGAVSRDLRRTCPDDLFDRANKLFLKEGRKLRYIQYKDEFGKLISKPDFYSSLENAKVPWYIPEWLGGLGLVERKCSASQYRLQQCAEIRRGLGNGDHRIYTLKDIDTWRFDCIAKQYLDDFAFCGNQNYEYVHYDGTFRDLEEENDKLYSLLVVEVLIKASVKELYQVIPKMTEEKFLKRAYQNNLRLWRPDSFEKDAPPMLMEDLENEKKIFPLSCFDVRYADIGPD